MSRTPYTETPKFLVKQLQLEETIFGDLYREFDMRRSNLELLGMLLYSYSDHKLLRYATQRKSSDNETLLLKLMAEYIFALKIAANKGIYLAEGMDATSTEDQDVFSYFGHHIKALKLVVVVAAWIFIPRFLRLCRLCENLETIVIECRIDEEFDMAHGDDQECQNALIDVVDVIGNIPTIKKLYLDCHFIDEECRPVYECYFIDSLQSVCEELDRRINVWLNRDKVDNNYMDYFRSVNQQQDLLTIRFMDKRGFKRLDLN